MPTASTPQPPLALARTRHRPWRKLAIGPRLLIGFQSIILLAGLLGLLAVERFSTLAAATTKLNSHDLPEFIALEQLRTQLFQQRHEERSLSAGNAQDRPGDLAALTMSLHLIDQLRAVLIGFEASDTPGVIDTRAIETLTDNLARSNTVALQVQSLVSGGQVVQARDLEQRQQEPLLQSTLDGTTRLRDLEQQETAATTARVQQESSQATTVVLVLFALFEPLAVVSALVLTRSLTRPLASLLRATQAMAAGNLDIGPELKRGDEIGQVAAAFDTMRGNLRTMIAALAREHEQTQAIIDASADGIALVDEQRSILQFNPAAERLSGWTTREALRRPCWEVFGCRGGTAEEAAQHERLCPIITAPQTDQGHATAELQAHLRNGARPWFAVSCAVVTTDALAEKRLVVGIHDVSQHKAVEQMKSDFVAMVSHELRAPLTTVAGSVELLAQLDPAADNESYQEVLCILDQQTRRLRSVIEEVLQVTRFDADHLQIQLRPLALDRFLRALLSTIRLEWAGEDWPLHLDAAGRDIWIWADQSLLEIVLRNLLDNIRKYAPARSPVEVAVAAGAIPDRVEVRVMDRGPGIPPAQLPLIFDRFARGTQGADGWTRGYGLGLYIAREVIRAHKGEIRAENRPGGGACFVLSLCAAEEEQPGAPDTAEIGTSYAQDDTDD